MYLLEYSSTLPQAEEWRPVVNYEGLYEVSSFGRIRKSTGRVCKASPNKYLGYPQVRLTKNKKNKCFYVHRLVAQSFIGKIPKGLCVNHKDLCKHNNNLSNLEIVTHKENIRHAASMGVFDNNGTIPNSVIHEVRSLKGKETTRSIGKRFGISQCHVSMIQNYKTRANT